MWLLCVAVALANTIDDVANPLDRNRWISDLADILPPIVEADLEQRLQALHDDLTVEVAVVTLNTIDDGSSPKSLATGLFNRWGLGNAEANNGLLVLMVMDQRRLEMETGYGLEGVLPDGFLGQVQAQHMVPHFREGDFGTGMVAGLEAIDDRLREDPEAARAGTGGPVDIPPPTTHQPSKDPSSPQSPLPSVKTLILLSGGTLSLCGFISVMFLGVVGVMLWRRREQICPKCKGLMDQLDEIAEDYLLSAAQKTEEAIGSVDWHVYHCVECNYHRTVSRRPIYSKYARCKQCKNRTCSSSSTTLQSATYTSGGLVQVNEQCAHCTYSRSYTYHTPVRSPPSSSASFSVSSSSSFSSSSSSSSSSSFFSSSGRRSGGRSSRRRSGRRGSGGGRSGGGGAGSSW